MFINSVTNILLHEKIQQVTDHGNLNDTLKLRKNTQLHSVSLSIQGIYESEKLKMIQKMR